MIKDSLLFFRLLSHRKKYMFTIIVYMFLYLFERAFSFIAFYLLGYVGEETELSPVGLILASIILCEAGSHAMSYFAGLTEEKVKADTCSVLSQEYSKRYLNAVPQNSSTKTMDEVSVLFREDLPAFVSYAGSFSNFCVLFPGALLIALGSLVLDWRLFAAAILFSISETLITNGLQKYRAKKIVEKRERAEAGIHSMMEAAQAVQTARWIPYLGKLIGNRFSEAINSIRRAQMSENRIKCILSCIQKAVSVLSEVGFLGVGGMLVFNGRLSIGLFLAVYSVRSSLTDTVDLFIGLRDAYREFQVSKNRLRYFDLPSETQSESENEEQWDTLDKLQLDGISFSYSRNAELITNLSITAQKGERVQLAGESGSGKSTILSLCAGMLTPDEGHFWGYEKDRVIALDGKMRKVSTVFGQTFHLFNETIRSNISIAQRRADEKEIRRAAQIAAIDDYIMQLPMGYDTVLSDNGSELSLGQRQRLMIARAVLANRPVWLMDEITASLDKDTADEITAELQPLMDKRIVLYASHKRENDFTPTQVVKCEVVRDEQEES